MTVTTKRRWFQFHLSTAIVLTLVAGILLGTNFIPNIPFQYIQYQYKAIFAYYYGWPASFAWLHYARTSIDGHQFVKGAAYPLEVNWIPGIVIDFCFYIVILLAIGNYVERVIYGREAKKS